MSWEEFLCWAQRRHTLNSWLNDGVKPPVELKFCLSKIIKWDSMVPFDIWSVDPVNLPQVLALFLVPAWKLLASVANYT